MTTIFVLIGQRKPIRWEDYAVIVRGNADEVKRIEIPVSKISPKHEKIYLNEQGNSIYEVEFPNDMLDTDIQSLIRRHYDTNPDTIRTIVQQIQ